MMCADRIGDVPHPAWPTQVLEDVGTLRSVLESRLRGSSVTAYLFRGQSNWDWDLAPVLARFVNERTITPEEAIRKEVDALELFAPLAEGRLAELERRPQGLEEWWSVMQHYGVPTRVLDWSPDPLVALWFAVRDNPHSDGAIWMVHPQSVQAWMRRQYLDFRAPNPAQDFYLLPRAPAQLFFGDVLLRSLRKEAQKGQFSWSRRVDSDHGKVIAQALFQSRDAKVHFRKLRVPAKRKAEFREALSGEGITDKRLFPDPESRLGAVARDVTTRLFPRIG